MRQSLLICNYSMDDESQVFSHQKRLALHLGSHFRKVTVITMNDSEPRLKSGVEVLSVGWKLHGKFLSTLRLIFLFLLTVKKQPDIIFFSHMTDFASAILGPICKIKKIPHVLWYAHTSNSKWLKLSIPFVDIVATSTPGSCPYAGPKLRVIGQSIDSQDFQFPEKLRALEFKRFLHVGRIDPSKQLEIVIETFINILTKKEGAILTLIGEPTEKYWDYYQSLIDSYRPWIDSGNIRFIGKRNRIEVINALSKADIFLHAFQGSLDKSILEATAMGVPVVTLNHEYCEIFYSDNSDCNAITHVNEFLNSLVAQYMSMSEIELTNTRKKRADIVHNHHSVESWTHHIMDIFELL